MGLTLYGAGKRLDLSSGGFLRLRRRVSDLCGEPWASHYRRLTDDGRHDKDDEWYREFDAETMRQIENKTINIKIVDFLLQSDMEGKINYGACKEILKVIGDYDDDFCYGYAALPDQPKFRDFKELLAACAMQKKPLRWN